MAGTQGYLLIAALALPLLVRDLRLGRRAGGLALRQTAIWWVVWGSSAWPGSTSAGCCSTGYSVRLPFAGT